MFELVVSHHSARVDRYSTLFAGWTGGMLSAVHLPPVHPVVPSFRRLNWRQDEIFVKKKISAYIFDKSEKNNIKIKKIP